MQTLTRPQAFRELTKLALPIILGEIGLMLIGTVDMMVAGSYSSECLAAVGLAISITNPIMILGLGLLFAISPLLAQKRGRGEDVSRYFWSVFIYSLIVGVGTSIVALSAVQFVPMFGYTENLTKLIQQFLGITSFSLLGVCIFQGVKEIYQAGEKTFMTNAMALGGVGVALLLNYSLVFGKWGFPHLHESGLAWSTLGVRWFLGISLFISARHLILKNRTIHWDFIRDTWRLGLPITISIFFEVMAFCSVTLFVGKFAQDQIAANNIALNLASLSFMIPLSIAAASGVKVGHAYGEKSYPKIKTFAQVAIMSSFCFTFVMSIIFFFFPEFVVSFYSKDPAVLEWGRKLLFWVACFQLFDGAQATMGGVLRGMAITRPSSIAVFIGYWLIGIPLGYYLGFHAGMEAQGFWIGLALSLSLVAVMLGGILKYKIGALFREPQKH